VFHVNLPATYVDVFKNGISVGLIEICGLLVDSTYHEFIPKEEGKDMINRFFRFGSYGIGIFINKSAIIISSFVVYLL
jgi:hypothetical protein